MANEKKSNFQNFQALVTEMNEGKMDERKRNAFRAKLLELHEKKITLPEEFQMLTRVLRQDRERGKLNYVHEYVLNEIEVKECDRQCVVKTDDAPAVHSLKKGNLCRLKRDYEKDRFIVYVPITVTGEQQADKWMARKINSGEPYGPSDLPKEKTLLRRLYLKEGEFSAWFEIVDDSILNGSGAKKLEEAFVL